MIGKIWRKLSVSWFRTEYQFKFFQIEKRIGEILMPYSKFTLSKAVEDFQLTIIEGDRFLPEITAVNPNSLMFSRDGGCSTL